MIPSGRNLKMVAMLTLLAGLLLVAVGTAQTTPEPPEPPSAPEPVPPVPPVGSTSATVAPAHPQVRVIYRARTDSLRKHIEEIEKKLAELEATGQQIETQKLQRDLQRLYKELARQGVYIDPSSLDLGKLGIDVDLPTIQVPRTIIDANGNTRVVIGTSHKPMHSKRGDQVGVFEDVYVDENEYVDQSAVAIFGDVHVDGHVAKEAVAVFGNVYVSGTVGGDVAAPFGDVYIDDGGTVAGDVSAVGVQAGDLAVIGGQIEEVHLPRLSWLPRDNGARSIYLMIATAAVTKAALSIIFGFLVLALVPRNVKHVEQRIRLSPIRSFLWGLLFQILILPVAAILVVTVIGIPVALLGLPLVIVVALLLGFVAFARILGSALISPSEPEGRRLVQYTVGALLIHVPFLMGLAMWSMPGPAEENPGSFVANLLIWAGLSVLYLISTVGFGAAIMSRFGSRPYLRFSGNAKGSPMPSANMPPPPSSTGPTPMPAPPSSGQ